MGMVAEINEKDFDEKIKEKCIIDFFATWCPPCKMLAPVIEEVSNEVTEVKYYKMNVDEFTDIAGRYRITHVPTVILFENGNEVKRVSGYIEKEQLINFINNI